MRASHRRASRAPAGIYHSGSEHSLACFRLIAALILLCLAACSPAAPAHTPIVVYIETNTPPPVTTLTPRPSPADGLTPIPPSADAGAMSPDERAMLALINAERTKAQRQPLIVDAVFQAVARARSADMLARNYFSHYDPLTGKPAAREMLAQRGVTVPMSENFYSTWVRDEALVSKAMAWFMADPPHRDNILLAQWNVVGIGIAMSERGTAVVTQVFGQR